MNLPKTFSILLVLLMLAIVTAKPVHAYIDPGAGSYAFQFLIASLLGGAFIFKSFLAKILNALIKKSDKSKAALKKKSKNGTS